MQPSGTSCLALAISRQTGSRRQLFHFAVRCADVAVDGLERRKPPRGASVPRLAVSLDLVTKIGVAALQTGRYTVPASSFKLTIALDPVEAVQECLVGQAQQFRRPAAIALADRHGLLNAVALVLLPVHACRCD